MMIPTEIDEIIRLVVGPIMIEVTRARLHPLLCGRLHSSAPDSALERLRGRRIGEAFSSCASLAETKVRGYLARKVIARD